MSALLADAHSRIRLSGSSSSTASFLRGVTSSANSDRKTAVLEISSGPRENFSAKTPNTSWMIALDMQSFTRSSMTRSIARSACPPGIARAEMKMLVSKTTFNGGVDARALARTICRLRERELTNSPANLEIRCAIATASSRVVHPVLQHSMICFRRAR